MSVMVPVSWGELLDKASILEIKLARVQDPAKTANIAQELGALLSAREEARGMDPSILGFEAELKAVNEALWSIEDEIRDCERRGDFGPRFIELARSVYRENDLRAAVKRRINERLGSDLVEEKSYSPY
jgi:hypothetical protein